VNTTVGILGCGYTGRALAALLAERGMPHWGTRTRGTGAAGKAPAGARVFSWEWGDPIGSHPADVLFVLAPPPLDSEFELTATLHQWATSAAARQIIGVVSTAVYGATRGVVTERTIPRPNNARHQRWARLELALHRLRTTTLQTTAVRTPAIYGPGRAFEHRPPKKALAIKPAPATSRIHVDDLAALLLALVGKRPPPILLACDDEPAPTWKVMAYAAKIQGVQGPTCVNPEEAAHHFSEKGLQMRLSGRRCRSVVRPHLGVALKYPNYRRGLLASLQS
jgi:nucleoside-diphosphate-sugar epimerase